MSDTVNTDGVIARYRAIAHAQAAFFTDMRQLLESAPCPDDELEEIRVVLMLTWPKIKRLAALARAFASSLPDTLESLRAGVIDQNKAETLFDVTRPLNTELSRSVEKGVLPYAAELTPPRLRGLAEQIIIELDPEGAQERHERRKQHRNLTIRKLYDGMGELRLYSSIDEIQAAYAQIDGQVRATRSREDDRTQDQARADLALAVLVAGGEGKPEFSPVKAEIFVTVPHDLVFGDSDVGAEMHGVGAIPANLARRLTAEAPTWRRLVTDPVSGVGMDLSTDRYRPTDTERDFIRARYQTCAFPGCCAPAVTCDIDHCTQRQEGGLTCSHNLAPLCRRHHRYKDEKRWSYKLQPNGDRDWTSPQGRQRRVRIRDGHESEAA
ncbi:HNH endonuclease [Pseudonocardiaceae bacterium YIM PH 21723]|nr:HNH endonuclease [Pseudonocardiaceae bacterium YIM PH 21723]